MNAEDLNDLGGTARIEVQNAYAQAHGIPEELRVFYWYDEGCKMHELSRYPRPSGPTEYRKSLRHCQQRQALRHCCLKDADADGDADAPSGAATTPHLKMVWGYCSNPPCWQKRALDHHRLQILEWSKV